MADRSRRNPRSSPVRALVMAALVGAGALAAGCSSPSTASVASLPGRTPTTSSGPLTQARSNQDMLDFTRCLRAHGLNEPDPSEVVGHGLRVQIPPPGPRTNAALSACNHYIVPIVNAKEAGASRQLAAWMPYLIRYAHCMQGHDIAMLDPTPQGSLELGNVPGISNGYGRYTPQFRAADAACRHLLPAAVHDNGTGP